MTRILHSAFPALLVALLPFVLLPDRAAAQGLEEIKADYTKYEYRIPMRDGKRLFTAVYVPKDPSQPYPILLSRTPYNVKPYGTDQYRENLGPSPHFGKAGYIFAFQDVRGRWMSEGDYVNMRPHNPEKKGSAVDESSDTYDTIDWLVKNVPNNNGRVGQYGTSYPGFYTACGMIDAHPALKAASPQAPVTDWFIGDDWHHNGALFLPHMFNFMARFDIPRPQPTKKFDPRFDHETPDGYDFFMKVGPLNEANSRWFSGKAAFFEEAMKHGTYDDYWQARNLRPHLVDVKPAVLTVGGWFDAENLFGALEVYKNLKKNSPKTSNRLVMGPWVHGGWSGGVRPSSVWQATRPGRVVPRMRSSPSSIHRSRSTPSRSTKSSSSCITEVPSWRRGSAAASRAAPAGGFSPSGRSTTASQCGRCRVTAARACDCRVPRACSRRAHSAGGSRDSSSAAWPANPAISVSRWWRRLAIR